MSIACSKYNKIFDVLYLDYTEHLFSSIKAYANINGTLFKGYAHITNNSLIFSSDNTRTPLTKYIYNASFKVITFSQEHIDILYHTSLNPRSLNDLNDATLLQQAESKSKKANKESKNSIVKKSSIYMFYPSTQSNINKRTTALSPPPRYKESTITVNNDIKRVISEVNLKNKQNAILTKDSNSIKGTTIISNKKKGVLDVSSSNDVKIKSVYTQTMRLNKNKFKQSYNKGNSRNSKYSIKRFNSKIHSVNDLKNKKNKAQNVQVTQVVKTSEMKLIDFFKGNYTQTVLSLKNTNNNDSSGLLNGTYDVSSFDMNVGSPSNKRAFSPTLNSSTLNTLNKNRFSLNSNNIKTYTNNNGNNSPFSYHTNNYQISQVKKIMVSNLSSLISYFQEKNLSLNIFIQLLHELSNNINSDSQNKSNISLLLLSYSHLKSLNRETLEFSNNENDSSSEMLLIINDTPPKIETFLNDLFEFTEAKSTHDEEDQDGIVKIISSRKIEELKQKYVIISPHDKEEQYDCINTQHGEHRNYVYYAVNAMKILPSKYQNGLFILTPEHYCSFIPVNNSINNEITTFHMKNVKYIIPYRFLYQYKSMNIFLYHSGESSIVIDFDFKEDYTAIYEYLLSHCPNLDKTRTDIKLHTNLWVDGLMSNYDYIMYLNEMSGRSFNDISQYPIFPWVLSNYSSNLNNKLDLNKHQNYRDLTKPMGLLKTGLNRTITEDATYIFRNYFSFPFVIFYYLMRSNPLYFLRYQGWSFGPADRMFNSIEDCFKMTYINKNALNDNKELIPEFYNVDILPNMLTNVFNINFGYTQTGKNISNVELPKYAKNVHDFAFIMRSALESEIASNSLNEWIDYIFGYKQQGDDEIGNLFYKTRYESCIGEILSKENDEIHRQCDLDDILECGQCPIQLFKEPHPKKRSRFKLRELFMFNGFNGNNSKTDELLNQKKRRLNIESKYEKERREKELQAEKIIKIFQEKEKQYQKEIDNLEKKIKNNEVKFQANYKAAVKINENLEVTFKEYEKNKEKIVKGVIEKLDNDYQVSIDNKLKNKSELRKALKHTEELDRKYTQRKQEFEGIMKDLNGTLEQFVSNNKELKMQITAKIKQLKNMPLNVQASVDGCFN